MAWTTHALLFVLLSAAVALGATLFPAGADSATGDAVDLKPVETLHANGAEVEWTKYSGPSGAAFDKYEVHRSTTAGFAPSASTLLTTIRDVSRTSYRDTTAAPNQAFSYKVVANASPSAEERVTLPATGKGKKILQPAAADGKATYLEKASSGTVSCTNAGAKPKLLAGASTWVDRSLVQFELQDLPANASVTSATLTLYRDVAAPAASTVDVHRAKGEWVEGKSSSACTGSGTSWDETEGGVDWHAKGGDFEATPAASVALTAGQAAGDDTFNVAPIVQDWANGKAPNHGFLLKARDETPTAGNTVSYAADDEATTPSRRPKLVVEYAESSPSKGPNVSVASPERDELVKGTVNVAAEAGDDRRVEKVEFLVDGVVVGTDTTEPYSVAWNTASATNAAHTLRARATDDVGNVKTSSGLAVTVGNSAPPTAKVVSPQGNYAEMIKGWGAHAYWRLGETTGTTVADASGRGNTGTLSGSYLLGQAGLITGDVDKAITFQNATTDGRVTAGPTVAGSSTATMSVEAWVDFPNANTTIDQYTTIASRGWGAAGGWRLSVYRRIDGGPGAMFQFNDAGTIKQVSTPVTAGKLHLVGRHTGSSIGLTHNGTYAYGTVVGTQAINTANSVLIGGDLHEPLRIDDVAMYNKSMSTDEASVHYDVGMGRTPRIAAAHTFSAGATDDRGVSKVNFYVDGARFGFDTTAPYSASLDTLDPSGTTYDGLHQITTRSFDADGNETDSTAQTVEVVNTAGTAFKADVAATTEAPAEVTYNPAATTQQKSGVTVAVKNTSAQTWNATDYVIRPRWATPEPVPNYVEGAEVPLGTDLAPGATKTTNVLVEPPALPEGVERAQYKLQVDVYKKSDTAFFTDKGNKPFEKPVTVKRQSTSDDLGLERFYHYEGEELGGGMQHLANVGNGNSLVRFTPASSTGRGLSTVVDLTYNSLEKKSESPVGNNWSLGISGLTRFGNPIDIHPNKADEIAGNANRYVDFTDVDGTTHRFIGKQAADGSVYWEEPAGVHLYMRTTSSADPARKWAITRPDRTTFYYDADGYPTLVEDANGNTITFTLEATPPGEDPGGPKKRVTTITDAGGRQYKIGYWAKADSNKPQIRGKIRKIVDHSGMEVTFQYYEDGNLLRIAQSGGTRSDGSNLSSRAWYFTYTTPNGEGPAIPVQADRMYPDAKTSSQSTRLYSVRDPRRHETTFEYAGVGAGQSRWKLISKTNRGNEKTTYAYDETNRVTTATAPLNRVTKYTFDTQAQVTKITNAKSEDTSIAWTADRHVQKVTRPKTATTTTYKEYAYNQNGQLTDTWDELRNHTELTYENLSADGSDTSGRWKAGRTIPHISRLKTKTEPRGFAATSTSTTDHQWVFTHDAKDNVLSVSDPEDKVTTYTYNADGTLATATDPLQHATKYPAYDPSGQPTEVVDAKNQFTRMGYDVDGYLRWIQDPNHADDTGAEPREFRTYFDYDTWHRMGRQSTPLSTKNRRGELIWSFADFDDNDNVYLQVAPHYGRQYSGTGARTTVDYDHMDRTWYVTGPDKTHASGETWKFEYDGAGRLSREENPRGFATTTIDDGTTAYEYDSLDRLTQRIEREHDGGTLKNSLRTHYCYDLPGDLRAVVPPKADVATVDCGSLAGLPRATRYDYDDAHRVVAESGALGHKRETKYDENGDVRATVDAAGQETVVDRDQRGLVTKVVEPFDAATSRKVTTKLEYDAAGNLKREITPRGWDASSDKVTFGAYVKSYEYDNVDQIVKEVLPTGGGTTTPLYVHRGYDANGNQTMNALPDAASDPAAVDAKKKTVLTHFDPGWIETNADRAKAKVRFEYTAEGWQRLRTPDKQDGTGANLARQREWSYFLDGQLEEERIATDESNSSTNTFSYDQNNNLTSAHNATGLNNTTKQKPIDIEAAYDLLDRPTKVRSRKVGDTNWNATTMGYDLNGNVTSRTDDREEDTAGAAIAGKAGRDQTFTFDEADRLQTQIDRGPGAGSSDDRRITTSFHPTGWAKERLIEQADSAGSFSVKQRTTWDYFLNGKLRTLVTKNGAGAVKEQHDVAYVDDATNQYVNGHRTKDVFKLDGPDTAAPCRTATCTTRYEYDARERLTDEKTDRDSGADPAMKYTLDSAGNITKEEHLGIAAPWTETSTYTGDQLETMTVSGSKTGSFKYFYDDAGNMNCVTTSVGTKDMCTPAAGTTPNAAVLSASAFDTDNRMVSHREFAGGVKKKDSEYAYDAFDRPVEQTENHAGFADPRVTLFKYVGLSEDVSEEEQRKGTADGAVDETKSYAYDAYGQRVGMTDKKGTTSKDFTYGNDVHGSISLLLNETGKAQASYGYTAYGDSDKNAYGQDGSLTSERDPFDTTSTDPSGQKGVSPESSLNPYRFSDKRLDTGSSTLDMGARRFGPEIGRFLQEDVYDDALNDLSLTEDPITQNRYALTGANPVSFVEVDGHMYSPDGGGGAPKRTRPSRRRTSRSGSVNNARSQSTVTDANTSNGYADKGGSSGSSGSSGGSGGGGGGVHEVENDSVSGAIGAGAKADDRQRNAQYERNVKDEARKLGGKHRTKRRTVQRKEDMVRRTGRAKMPEPKVPGIARGVGKGLDVIGAVGQYQESRQKGHSQGKSGARAVGSFLGGTAVSLGCGAVGGPAAAAACGFVLGPTASDMGADVGEAAYDVGNEVGDFLGL